MGKKKVGKKITACILSAGMLFSMRTAAEAETLGSEWNVSFTAANEMDSDYTASDVSNAVYGMQPGDDMEIRLNLRNDNAAAANWYMTNEVLQSLEETAGSSASGGAYEYELIYTAPDGAEEILFTSDTVGGESTGDRVGLHGATSGLEDYFYLDTLAPGQQGLITLRVALDGETQGNAYQNTLASLQMNFAVDTTTEYTNTVREVVEEGNPGEGNPGGTGDGTGNGSGGSGNRTGIVRTSDENSLVPFFVAAGISGLLLLLLAAYGLKERRKQRKAGAAESRVLGIMLPLCLVLTMGNTASASESQNRAGASAGYTYTVRLFSGAQGTIDGEKVCRIQGSAVPGSSGEVYEISGLRYGEQVTFNVQSGVTLDGSSKYYVRGIRQSGADNSTVGNLSFTVTGDQDYVVAYGIKGATVAYTVNYLDEAGNALAPSETYYGNVGDKPVVAYQYIEGWQPQAYNLGKTLVEDVAENVFSFIYIPVPVNTVVDRVTVPAPQVPEQPQTPEQPQPPAPEGPTEEATVPEQPDEPVEIGDNEIPTNEPEDYRDLDEQDTPTGGYNQENNNQDGDGNKNALTAIIEDFATPLTMLPTPVKAGIGIAIVVLAGGLIGFLLFHKKRKKQDEQ